MQILRIALFLPLLFSGSVSYATVTADWGGMQFSGSGFLTASIGKMLDGSVHGTNDLGYNCPCQIVDYSQGAVMENESLSVLPNSKLGLQGSIRFTDKLSVTTQVMVRGALKGQPELEWTYASYQLTPSTTLQLGRKRLPLFYHSETQEVGFTYPWAHLAREVYGWPVVNYNGINVLHKMSIGHWSASISAYVGEENRLNSAYDKIYSGINSRYDERREDIAGGEVLFSKGWFEGRLMYLQMNGQNRDPTGSDDWSAKSRERFYGFSTAMTPGNWVLHTEVYSMTSRVYGAIGSLAAVGYRLSDWLPMVTYSVYHEFASNPSILEQSYDTIQHNTLSLSLRYDLSSVSDIKLQYDYVDDNSGPYSKTLYGNSHALYLNYDMVF